jgi:hypothetical protein
MSLSLTPYQIRLRPRERALLERMAVLQRRRPQEQAAVLIGEALEAWAAELGEIAEPETEPEVAVA